MNERLDHNGSSELHRLESAEPALVAAHPSAMPVVEKRRLSKTKVALLSCFGLVVVLGLGIGGVLWALLNHSVSNEQVRWQIQSQLNAFLGDNHSAVIGDTKVALGDGGLLSIDATDVKFLRGETINLGVAREVGVKIKSVPLVSGNVVAESITIRGASIALDAIAKGRTDNELRPVWPRSVDLAAALQPLGEFFADIAMHATEAGLESVALEDTNLVGFDQLGMRSRTARIDNMVARTVEGDGQGDNLEFEALLKTEFSDWTMDGSWTVSTSGSRILDFRVDGLSVNDLIGPTVNQNSALTLTHPVSLQFSVAYAPDGTPQPADAEVTVGAGAIPVGKGMQANLQEAVLNIRLDPQTNQLVFRRSTLRFEGANAIFTGGIRYPVNDSDSISLQPVFRIDVEEFDAFGLVEQANAVPKGKLLLEGFLDPLRQRLEMDRIVLSTPNGSVEGEASIRFDTPQPHIKIGLEIADMPVDEFKQFWPAVLAPKARNWMGANLTGGRMKAAWMKADFPPGVFGKDELYKPENLAVRIPIESTNLKNPGELPVIRNTSGVLNVTGNESNVVVSSGTATIPGAGKLKLLKSTLVMGNYAIPVTPTELKLNFAGPAGAMVKLASLEPLGFESRLNINAKNIKGRASADVTAYFLIAQSMTLDKKPWRTKLKAVNVSSSKPVQGRRMQKANLTIVATPKEAKVSGTAVMDGVPIKLSLVENLDGKTKSQSKVVLTLTDKARKQMGFDTGGVITGPIAATITSLKDGSQKVEANLKSARLDFPWVGWSKGKGIAAKASFIMKQTGAVTTFRDVNLRGQGFSAKGSLTVDDKGLRDANVKNVVLNQVDDFDIKAKRNGKTYQVDLNARSYDGRSLVRSLLNAELKPGKNSKTSVSVKGRVDRLLGFGGQELKNVRLDYLQQGNRVTRVNVDALAANKAVTKFSLGPVPGGTKTEIYTTNGGAFLEFLNLYTKARGGTISANLVRDNSQVFRGVIFADKFTLLNEPRLAQMLRKAEPSADVTNTEEVLSRLRQIKTDKARVDHLQANIEKGPGFFNITKGRLTGGDASAAFQGPVYDKNNRMNIKGTYLPGRSLNRLVSKIPIIGLAFGRGKVNGLLGITFQLKGRFDNPTLRVNPLSIIAPGVFRQIFKF